MSAAWRRVENGGGIVEQGGRDGGTGDFAVGTYGCMESRVGDGAVGNGSIFTAYISGCREKIPIVHPEPACG